MIIKEIILKHNMVIPGYPLNFYNGLSISITDRAEDPAKESFVSGIEHFPEDSDFIREREMSSGCYVVSIAEMGNSKKESCMVMEDVVAMVLFIN